ncbi:hypothetical protein DH09_01290 (plasmid) [Bacillaceae bacterium JMAK1]|nr:hypothetical protein DH09_01290 [Bacillaceae bacterium JMAK1]
MAATKNNTKDDSKGVQPKYNRVIGIDIGNGLLNIRSITNEGRNYSLTLPSAFAFYKDVGAAVSSKELDVSKFEIEGSEYAWGEEIRKISKLQYSYGHENRYRTDAYIVMVKIALARAYMDLGIKQNDKVLIVTGVPSGETGTMREQEIEAAFLGTNVDDPKSKPVIHDVVVDGNQMYFKVDAVKVLPQALSTVLGRYLDLEGMVEDDDYEEMKVAVIDIGGGTTDLDIVDNLRRLNEYQSIPRGFRDVYNAIREQITNDLPGHQVSDYKLLEVLEEGKEQKEYIYRPSKRVDGVNFTNTFNRTVREMSMEIQELVTSTWKDHSDIDEVLLVGGGAHHFEQHITRIITGITIPNNNGSSNVEGYYRYGIYKISEDDE